MGGRDERAGQERPTEPERPSMAELRRRFHGETARITTGWPVLDSLGGGLQRSRTTIVRAPADLRLQVLGRTVAWAAGEGYPAVLAARSRTTEELWLAVAAGALGLPPTALVTTTAHDEWIDARLRVVDVRVLGGEHAPADTARALAARPASLLVVDDYETWAGDWAQALDPRFEQLDLHQWPRTAGCTLVLGMTDLDSWSQTLERGITMLRLAPDEHLSRVVLSCDEYRHRRHRTVLLRDGFLDAPAPGAPYVRRPGAVNLWEDRSAEDISSFAAALGSEPVSVVWESEEDGERDG